MWKQGHISGKLGEGCTLGVWQGRLLRMEEGKLLRLPPLPKS